MGHSRCGAKGRLSMPRFVLTSQLGTKGTITGEEAHHILRVHRHKLGDTIAVSFRETVFSAQIVGIDDQAIYLELYAEAKDPEPPIKITLYQAILKGEKFDYALAKAVELGVYKIVPLSCERVVVRLLPAKEKERVVRWQRLALEATKQCGRAIVPEVTLPLPLPLALSRDSSTLKLVAYEKGGLRLREVLSVAQSISCVVGPEGGLTEEEVRQAKDCGFIPITLGPRILRAETASLCLLSIIMYELGDL